MADLHCLLNHSNLIHCSPLLSSPRSYSTLACRNPSAHRLHRHSRNRRLDRMDYGNNTTPKTNRRNPTRRIEDKKKTQPKRRIDRLYCRNIKVRRPAIPSLQANPRRQSMSLCGALKIDVWLHRSNLKLHIIHHLSFK